MLCCAAKAGCYYWNAGRAARLTSPMVSLATTRRLLSEVVARAQGGSRWLFVLQARRVKKKTARAEQSNGLCCLTHKLNGHIMISPLVLHSDKHLFLLCRFLCFPTPVSSLTQMNRIMRAPHGTEAPSVPWGASPTSFPTVLLLQLVITLKMFSSRSYTTLMICWFKSLSFLQSCLKWHSRMQSNPN